MAPRRRRAAAKGPTGPTSRVHAIESAEQWDNMLRKTAATGRLLVVQLFTANNYACAQMRQHYKRMSVDASMRGAVFAELDVNDADDDLLEACGVAPGFRIPCYRCYVGGELEEEYVGGVPNNVAQMIARQLSTLRSSRGLLTKLLLAAGGAAAVAAGLWWHFTHGSGAGGGAPAGDLGEELRQLGERLRLAQTRKRNCERVGKLKGAKNQARIIRQLEAQRRAVEAQLHAREHPGQAAAAAGGGGGRRGKGRRSGRRGHGGGAAADEQSPLPEGMVPTDADSEDEVTRARRRRRQAVAYSDEE